MKKEDKRRLYIIGGVILVAVILWLLLRRKPANTLVNKGGVYDPNFYTEPMELGDIPSLDYTGPRTSSRGCAVCYSGYGRIIAPSPSPPAPTITLIQKFLSVNSVSMPTPPPVPEPRMPTGWSNTGPVASPFPNYAAPGGRW